MMTRQEHLDWCKRRALELLDAGDTRQALDSMLSDLRKHPETEKCAEFGAMFLFSSVAENPAELRRFINGFN